jgi:hypothetical protein
MIFSSEAGKTAMYLYGKENFIRTVQILYSLSKGEALEYLNLIKLLYFAERYHLRKYGSLIIPDRYIAMKLGPVQSQTKDLLTHNEVFLANLESESVTLIKNTIEKTGYTVQVHNPDAEDNLSESDLEAVDFSYNNFYPVIKEGKYALADLTHDYPEWHRFSADFRQNKNLSVEMDLMDFFKNPDYPTPFIEKYLSGKDPFLNIDAGIVTARALEFSNSGYLE